MQKKERAGLEGIGRSGGQAESDAVLAAGRGLRLPVQVRLLAGGPLPVFEPGYLHALHDRTGDFDVRVTPRADLGILAEILITDVVTTDEGGLPIHDHDLAMVAKVELEAVRVSLARVERPHLRAR